jgi:zinc and cadmium transporter
MWLTWLWIGLAILFDGLAGLAGGVLPERVLTRYRPALIGFAAGALLGAAFLDVLPNALKESGARALHWTLLTFVAMALFEWSIARHHHRRGRETTESVLPIVLLGSDALHNIGDGAAIAAAFIVSTRLGIVTSLAVIVHEVPEEVGDYVILRMSGLERRRALIALAGVQLSAAIGAVAVLAAWSLFKNVAGVVLALAGGTFLYIGAADLLPHVLRVEAGKPARRSAMIGFIVGVILLIVMSR